MPDSDDKASELRTAIAGLEAQRSVLGDSVIGPAIAALRSQLQGIEAGSSYQRLEERKTVTILFVDVSGFTALAEKLDPEEVRSVINACFDVLVPIVQKYEGTIDKFIGDEIMALFGAPLAHENDPERALRAGLEMMDAISVFNQQHGTALSLHIGVNTGPVVTGAIGSQDRKDYSVMGDAVNLAARLEDASADGQIFVGPGTYKQTEALFDFDPLPPLALKGKTESLALYRVIGLKQTPKSTRGIEGLRSELIGRERELDVIGDAIRKLRVGSGGIVAVIGDAGVGKSRLVYDSLGVFASDLTRTEGRALSHTSGMNYWVAADLLRGLLRVRDSSRAEEIDFALREKLGLMKSLPFLEVYPYLATLLQLPLAEEIKERVAFLSTEALQKRLLQSLVDFVSACANHQPLILFWEDVHWCDPSSLLALKVLLALTSRFPLLIVMAYRRGEERKVKDLTSSLDPGLLHVIQLAPLTQEESTSLVERLLQIQDLPDAIRDVVLDRAEGNPFFIEELLRSLLDSGAVAVQNGRMIAVPGTMNGQVPETVQGVITARMDRLMPEQKNVLQTASVIGRVFQRNVLDRVAPPPTRRSLDVNLAELEQRDFIEATRAASNPGEFMIKHAITQDVAYNALLKSRRRQIHQTVGEALEELFPERINELSATLAYHFERADAPEKAFLYSKQAGKRAQAVFANTEATAFYQSAVEHGSAILRSDDTLENRLNLAEAQELLGDVLHLAGKNDDARNSYVAVLGGAPNGDHVRRSRVQRKIGSTYTVQRRYQAMSDAFDAAEAELGERPTEPVADWWAEKMQVLLERLHLYYWQGMSDEMMKLAEQFREDIEQKGTPIQRGKFFQMLGLSDLTRTRYAPTEEAVKWTELAVSTSSESSDLAEAAHVRFTAGLTRLFRGNLAQAIEHYQAALSLAQRVGDLIVQTRCLAYLAVAYRRSHDLEQTRVFGERTIAMAAQLGMVEYVAMAKANLAWLAWRENELAVATSLGQEALKEWHAMEDPYGVDWQALLPIVAVAASEQRWNDAVAGIKELFGENQHPLPDPLVAAAQAAISASEKKDANDVRAAVERLVQVSEQIGYL